MTPLLLCLVAAVTDGDSIRCQDGTRLRLAEIDAPEIHCQPRRPNCRTEGAIASRDNLRRIAGKRVLYRVVDANLCRAGFQSTDRYGRRVVRAYVDGVDLGWVQLRDGFARKWECR